MRWSSLRDAGVPDLLRKAADILMERGWVKGVTVHRNSGQVDVEGALALAAGVPWPRLGEDFAKMVEAAPPRKRALLVLTVETLDAYVGQDLVSWNDKQESRGKVVGKLEKLAESIDATL